ncbi:transglutaminase-like domain-containing protein [Aliiglaciecola sp. LCG003]|uniref:transglutaminase-like domain-containing protein n=1 Tax=Aliiglaciecola sp. LCG003 TaxID=3053655 RepID=UPI002572F6EC|nr:transglutaminase-like domain-containing protein [Aliiglaciecola sp. LCG003]WJG10857.1 transglutaminase-like domain-containing protein [Aliiglaciecola sp. LCG003]
MNLSQYLQENEYFNYSHPSIQSLISSIEEPDPYQKIIAAYYLIRDNIAYNPYTFSDGVEALKASYAATHDSAYCIPKSALLVAVSRALGIPARIGLGDVRNHLSSPKLIDWLKTDLFVMHGYAEIYMHDKWVKCTPVFNHTLCEKFNIQPLNFDGKSDSLFHSFTQSGDKHMEYVTDHGSFAEMPVEKIFDAVSQAYPHISLFNQSYSDATNRPASLEAEITKI